MKSHLISKGIENVCLLACLLLAGVAIMDDSNVSELNPTIGLARRYDQEPLQFMILPIVWASKRAFTEGWEGINFNESKKLDATFSVKRNIGINLGASAVVDIDIDSEECLPFADVFLPPTPWVFGRKSKPRSHYLYRLGEDEIEFDGKSWNLDVKRTGVPHLEMRTGNHYTVLPGSKHEDGEMIEWDGGVWPTEQAPTVTEDELRGALNKMATCAIVARYWGEGVRDNLAHAFAGTCLKAGWSVEEVSDAIELISRGANDRRSETRKWVEKVPYWKERLDKEDKPVAGIPQLMSIVGAGSYHAKSLLRWLDTASGELLDQINGRWALIRHKGNICALDKPQLVSGGPEFILNHSGAIREFRSLYGPGIEIGKGKKKALLPVYEVWCNSNPVRYMGIGLYPPGATCPPDIFNAWQGFPYKPEELMGETCWERAMFEVAASGNQRVFDHLMDGIAHIFLYPHIKAGVLTVLMSRRQGTGKTTLMKVVVALLGKLAMTTERAEDIAGARFNSVSANRLLLHLEEGAVGQTKEMYTRLKRRVTDSTMMMEAKGRDQVEIPDYARIYITTNDERHYADSSDRRSTFIEISDSRALDKPYWAAVEAESFNPRALSSIMYRLMRRKVSERLSPLDTSAKRRIKAESLEPFLQMIRDQLKDGTWWNEGMFSPTGEYIWVPCSIVSREYARLAPYDKAYEATVGRQLNRLFEQPSSRPRRRVKDKNSMFGGGKPVRHYVFPLLEEAKAEFCKYTGYSSEEVGFTRRRIRKVSE